MRKFLVAVLALIFLASTAFAGSFFKKSEDVANKVKDAAVEGAKEAVEEELSAFDSEVKELAKPYKDLVEGSKEWLSAKTDVWNGYESADALVDKLADKAGSNLKKRVKAQIKKIDAAKKLVAFGESAKKTEVEGILAWQFQNLGYVYIKEIKTLTNYQERMDAIADLNKEKKYKEKKDLIEETKNELRKYEKEISLAAKNMVKASQLHNSMEKKDSTYALRGKRIESNLSWIDWVQNFIKK